MKKIIVVTAAALLSVIVFNYWSARACAQTGREDALTEANKKVQKPTPSVGRSRRRAGFIKTADFYLKDETLVHGKLISDDKNKIIIEQIEEGKIVVSTYSKRDINSRSLRLKSMSEVKYYLDLGKYFTGRTWDFADDPDDFIQAIRCYETAKQRVLKSHGRDDKKVAEIEQKIEQLQEQRKVWTREVRSRAELKKLEFDATLATRLEELEDKIDKTGEQINAVTAAAKTNQEQLTNNIARLGDDIFRELEILNNWIEGNSRIIDSVDRAQYRYRNPVRSYHYNPYVWRSSPAPESTP